MSEHQAAYAQESFTDPEIEILEHYFTNIDKPVFCLINLPEVVKGALYARYSRSAKSTRRLFLDEFVNRREIAIAAMSSHMPESDAEAIWQQTPHAAFYYIAKLLKKSARDLIFSIEHAEGLYRRVFDEYGDDSVAQLGGVHIVFEQASNIVINEIEWGRLGAYLEQSTRYIDYSTRQPDGRNRCHLPADVMSSDFAAHYTDGMDKLFLLYNDLVKKAIDYFTVLNSRADFDGDDRAYRMSIRAKAFDAVRPVLPAGIVSNVGFFGSAQAAANMLRRLLGSDLAEARKLGQMALEELRHPDAAPAFFNQIDDPKKGLDWIEYQKNTTADARQMVDRLIEQSPEEKLVAEGMVENEVKLAWSDPDNQRNVCSGIIYELSSQNLTMWEAYEQACLLNDEAMENLIAAYVGNRGNRRWKPGRAFELATYNFDMIIDFGIMRDFKRHRMLTAMWGRLDDSLGWTADDAIEAMGGMALYEEAMQISSNLHQLLRRDFPEAAQYAICLAYRMRFMISINARALLFMLELRTSQQGHPAYRKVGQLMHQLVAGVDPLIASSMSFVDYNQYSLERGEAEKRLSQKRSQQSPR